MEVLVKVTARGAEPVVGVPVKFATGGGGIGGSRGTCFVGECALIARSIISGNREVIDLPPIQPREQVRGLVPDIDVLRQVAACLPVVQPIPGQVGQGGAIGIGGRGSPRELDLGCL